MTAPALKLQRATLRTSLGENAEVPSDLRAKVERHLRETPSATWDSIVRDIAIGELEDA